jgi:hypothetical protein
MLLLMAILSILNGKACWWVSSVKPLGGQLYWRANS